MIPLSIIIKLAKFSEVEKLFDIYSIDLNPEFSFRTSKSSGKGGQHVNKTESRVELLFDVNASGLLPLNVKEFLLEKIVSKYKDGIIQIASETHRSQHKNREETISKIYSYLDQLLKIKKKRKKTKVPKSVKEKRLNTKKRKSDIKKLRRKDF